MFFQIVVYMYSAEIEVYFIYYDQIKCFSHIHVHKSHTPVPPLLENSTLHNGHGTQ